MRHDGPAAGWRAVRDGQRGCLAVRGACHCGVAPPADRFSPSRALIVNPAFNPLTTFGDAALLILATPSIAPPIALASPLDNALLTPARDYRDIAGWGLTSGTATTAPLILQAAATAVQSSAYCVQRLFGSSISFSAGSMLCAIEAP